MPQRIEFTEAEIKALSESPVALKALADWNYTQWVMGNAMGFDCLDSLRRNTELTVEANRLYQRSLEGNDPGFTD